VNLQEKTDEYLLECLKNDDHNAFNKLYDKYWDTLYVFAYRLTRDKDSAFLIIQDLFVMLWEKRHQHEILSLKSYLFQSVKYRFFQQYKNKSKEISIENLTIELENYLFENIDEANLEILKNALKILPEKRKKILLMNKYQNMPPKEIAEVLNISTQTVRNQLTVSLAQLRLYFLNYHKKQN